MQGKGQGRTSLALALLPFIRGFLARLKRQRRAEAVIDRAYPAWARRDNPNPEYWRGEIAALKFTPIISIVMPVCDPDADWLREAILSVRGQFYDKWELLIADDYCRSPEVVARLSKQVGDPRVDVVRMRSRVGISAATNAALSRATGLFVTFLDHDDVLAPHALAAVARAIAETPDLDMVFSDEDQLVNGKRARPYFKPGWNPDLLLSQNVVCHLAAYRRALVTRLGGLRSAYDGSQDHDLALRAVADTNPRKVRHLPMVLYHWRQSATAMSAVAEDACRDAARRAIADHLSARGRVAPNPTLPQWPVVRFDLPGPAPRISIITEVPTEELGALYYDPTKLEHVPTAREATGDVLIFVARTLRPRTPDWLGELAAQASRPEIGAAGARLTGPDGTVVHAGFVLDPVKVAQSPAPHADANDPGYRGHFRLPRTVAAISGDCYAVRRTVYEAAGGFDASAGDFADVDFCLRLAARGLRTVWTAHAWLQYTANPRAKRSGAVWMRGRWAAVLRADPYGNPNLRLSNGQLRLVRRKKK
ncbi:MAG: glycosyltransferase [Rhodospirillales bacterium]